jgi:ATP-dependent Clp protease ATP-binding subunit ClpA
LKYSFSSNIKNLSTKLKSNIFGQDHIIDEVIDILKINYSGLGDDKKPIGSFLFVGSTGVGKTELAIQLSKELKLNFKRFDMSEYSEKHSVKNFIGGDAGLVGYEDGGLLTNYVDEFPKSVILFDEIEKAHSDVMNIFLQILDYGHLTSTKGNEVFFNDSIIIFTSNLGVPNYQVSRTVGFFPNTVIEEDYDNDLESFLKPEFRGRLDSILTFKPLNNAMISSIIDKNINELSNKLKNLNITITLSDELKKHIINNLSLENLGARSVAKIIRDKIKTKIANVIINEDVPKNANIYFSLEKQTNDFILEIKNIPNNSKSIFEVKNYSFFKNAIEAQEYAKANPLVTITRSPCGNGYVVKELEIINGGCV